MAGAKEIRTQIRSIQNTQKITRAMEMVAASKMRRAQERMEQARPYADKIRNVVAHMAYAHLEYQHPFFVEREVKNSAVIVVSTDRGLCGGLNANLFRMLVRETDQWRNDGQKVHLSILGKKAMAFFGRMAMEVVAQGPAPAEMTDEELAGPVGAVMKLFMDGEVDRVYVAYNRFVNSMTQTPTLEQLVPLVRSDFDQLDSHWDYLYEPEAQPVVDRAMTRYMESLVLSSCAENLASEQAARMVAMKSASDNASNLIGDLQLMYNKARQAAITQELSEIVGGAAAV